MISILLPSRNRPGSLVRLISSLVENSKTLTNIEVLIYLDEDDTLTREKDFTEYQFVHFYRGKRLWMSLAQNVLYAHCRGDIIMACADDFVFNSKNWDEEVEREFQSKSDPFWMLFGNDLGTHAGKLSTHFFLRKEWVETLGAWVFPGRNSLWDLWAYEVATDLGRVIYRDDLIFEHLNFRQSNSKLAIADENASRISDMNAMFSPNRTYAQLRRERRIDYLLLTRAAGIKRRIKTNYFIAELIVLILNKKLVDNTKMKLLTLTNLKLFQYVSGFVYRKIFHSNK